MILSRRDMLKLTAGASAALAFGRMPAFAQGGPINKRPIPSTGEMIPVVGLGTARTFNAESTPEQLAPLIEVMKAFTYMGGTVLDTAPSYGKAEVVCGNLIEELDLYDKLFVATKVRTEGVEAGIEQMENSMEVLHREVIDLMQIHNLRDWQNQLATLRDWKAEGKFRYIGMTTSSGRQYEDFAAMMEKEDLDFVQINYSLGQRQAEERLLPLAADRGMAVLVNLPYGRGRLFEAVEGQTLPEWAAEFDAASWGQLFLKYILGHPAVTCPIPATTKAHHAEDNMGAAYGRYPDEAMRKKIVEWFEAL
jgi:aryl-alcohol dehydrogenase-like predicted oxidoreductase